MGLPSKPPVTLAEAILEWDRRHPGPDDADMHVTGAQWAELVKLARKAPVRR